MTPSHGDVAIHKLSIQVYKDSFKFAWKCYLKYWPILQIFCYKFFAWASHKIRGSQQASRCRIQLKELFQEFKRLTRALKDYNGASEQSLGHWCQRSRPFHWNQVLFIGSAERYWDIDLLATYGRALWKQVISMSTVCVFQLTYGVGSNLSYRLRRAREKPYTSYFQLGTLLHFDKCDKFLSDGTLVLTQVKPDALEQ